CHDERLASHSIAHCRACYVLRDFDVPPRRTVLCFKFGKEVEYLIQIHDGVAIKPETTCDPSEISASEYGSGIRQSIGTKFVYLRAIGSIIQHRSEERRVGKEG